MSVDPVNKNPNTVVRYSKEKTDQHEDAADVAVIAGDLLEVTATGVRPHSTAAGVAGSLKVALDARQRAMEFGDQYDPGENVIYVDAHGGGYRMRLASGQNVARGTPLVSNGNGTLRAYIGTGTTPDNPANILFEAEEAKDASTSTVTTDPDTPDASVGTDVKPAH